jgi:hypothetical protein
VPELEESPVELVFVVLVVLVTLELFAELVVEFAPAGVVPGLLVVFELATSPLAALCVALIKTGALTLLRLLTRVLTLLVEFMF